jgi:hypothetical protein
LSFLPATHHQVSSPQPSLPADLLAADLVYVLMNSHCFLLEQYYQGPFQVVPKYFLFFIVQLGNKQEKVSILHLKGTVA